MPVADIHILQGTKYVCSPEHDNIAKVLTVEHTAVEQTVMAQCRANMAEKVDIDIQTMRAKARHVVPLLKMISNENRLLILCHLGKGEMSVTELNERFDLSQSALSQHLAKLRQDGLVKTRRDSQMIYYSLASPEAARLIEFLHEEFC